MKFQTENKKEHKILAFTLLNGKLFPFPRSKARGKAWLYFLFMSKVCIHETKLKLDKCNIKCLLKKNSKILKPTSVIPY